MRNEDESSESDIEAQKESFAEDLRREEQRAERTPMRVAVLVLGLVSCALIFFTGPGNIAGLGAGIAGIVLTVRSGREEPGRTLCVVGTIGNAVLVVLVVVGFMTLSNCVGLEIPTET